MPIIHLRNAATFFIIHPRQVSIKPHKTNDQKVPMIDKGIWDFADKIVCINLIDRDDRKKMADQQFAKVGLSNRVSFYRPERSPHGGGFGCFESHLNVMKQALKDGLQNLLILEYDVQFHDGWEENVGAYRKFIDVARKKSIPWDAFYIGGTLLWIEDVHVPCRNVIRGKLTCAHAYLVNESGMRSFVEREQWIEAELKKRTQDIAILDVWQNIYSVCSPWNIKQEEESISDNSGDVHMGHMTPEVRTLVQHTALHVQGLFGRLLLNFKTLRWLYGNTQFPPGTEVIDDGRVHLALPGTFSDIFVATIILLVLFSTLLIRGPPKPPVGAKRCSRIDVVRQVAELCGKYFKK